MLGETSQSDPKLRETVASIDRQRRARSLRSRVATLAPGGRVENDFSSGITTHMLGYYPNIIFIENIKSYCCISFANLE